MSKEDFTRELIVRPGSKPRLRDQDANRDCGWTKPKAQRALGENRKRLEALQDKFYADGRFAMLVVLQGIDAGGKDGTIRHVMTAFNPQGCTVTSFKAPTGEELRHDYLWRIHHKVPARGEIGIFNRSHYEEVLIVRVNELVPQAVWSERYDQINEFERMLTANGVHIVKFFLHISPEEQKRRFEARLKDPAKRWKFNPDDLTTRKQWGAYQEAFETMLSRCSTKCAPWYLIPADHKWFRNLAVSQILVAALEALPLRFPQPGFDPAKVAIR